MSISLTVFQCLTSGTKLCVYSSALPLALNCVCTVHLCPRHPDVTVATQTKHPSPWSLVQVTQLISPSRQQSLYPKACSCRNLDLAVHLLEPRPRPRLTGFPFTLSQCSMKLLPQLHAASYISCSTYTISLYGHTYNYSISSL